MDQWNDRTVRLIGEDANKKLASAKIIVFGVGGVGGYVVEALARAGVRNLAIVDYDTVSLSNINRQIIATHKTIGKSKVKVMKARLLDINPDIEVTELYTKVTPENIYDLNLGKYDFVVDAIDSFDAKIEIIKICHEKGINIISAMGAGNKLNSNMYDIIDISKTSVCPMARKVRKKLKELNINHLWVLSSTEQMPENVSGNVISSISYAVGIAGLKIAEHVIKTIINS